MIKTCNMYNLNKDDIYIQLQHRVEEDYILNIKKKVSKNLIITIGLFQIDFYEYFWKIHKKLNPETDYILIDMSKHQPDLIAYSEEYKDNINKCLVLNHIASLIEKNEVPIIIADDTTPEKMNEYLKILSKYNINVAGIDMQNVVEYLPNEQRYQNIKCGEKQYTIKIRKASNKLAVWKDIIKNYN